jgi:hypothetical protein
LDAVGIKKYDGHGSQYYYAISKDDLKAISDKFNWVHELDEKDDIHMTDEEVVEFNISPIGKTNQNQKLQTDYKELADKYNALQRQFNIQKICASYKEIQQIPKPKSKNTMTSQELSDLSYKIIEHIKNSKYESESEDFDDIEIDDEDDEDDEIMLCFN